MSGRIITTMSHLNELPDGAAILWDDKVYGASRAREDGRPYWFRPGRFGQSTINPSNDCPAVVLYEPEATR